MPGLVQVIPRNGSNPFAPQLPFFLNYQFNVGTVMNPDWSTTGVWTHSDGAAYPPAAGNREDAIVDSGRVNGWIDTTFTRDEAPGLAGIIFRATNLDNYWRLLSIGTNGHVNLIQRVNGVETTVIENLIPTMSWTSHWTLHLWDEQAVLYTGAAADAYPFTLPQPTGAETWHGLAASNVTRFEFFTMNHNNPRA